MATIITADNLKDWLKITDAADDTNLAIATAAANEAVVKFCGRSFEKVTTPTARVFVPDSCVQLEVDDFWTTTGLIVATDNAANGTYSTTWAAADYYLRPFNGRKNGADWPYETITAARSLMFPHNQLVASVRVTASWGWSVIPEDVFTAALLKAARLFSRKDSPDGVLGGYSDLGAVRVSLREDPDLTLLLEPYRRPSNKVLIA